MYVRCWQCSEELDISSSERAIYQKLITYLRLKMCNNTIDDECSFWWRHEDCFVISSIIKDLKEKL